MFDFFMKKSTKPKEQKSSVKPKENFSNIDNLVKYFKDETGVSFEKQTIVLKNKVINFCRLREIYSYDELINTAESDIKIKQELINSLTTNETYFYREFRQIEKLIQLIQASSGTVKILCAPSSTGEEPYSIAIALLEAGVLSSKFEITGVDIDTNALQKASHATYKGISIRNLSTDILNKYFTKEDENYTIKSEISSLVTFKQANIFDKSFSSLGKFDFIFSRNMLIYFDKETKIKAKKILESMRKDTTHDVFFGHADLF